MSSSLVQRWGPLNIPSGWSPASRGGVLPVAQVPAVGNETGWETHTPYPILPTATSTPRTPSSTCITPATVSRSAAAAAANSSRSPPQFPVHSSRGNWVLLLLSSRDLGVPASWRCIPPPPARHKRLRSSPPVVPSSTPSGRIDNLPLFGGSAVRASISHALR